VLFKSSKLLPVMFFRFLLGNGSNGWTDYVYALLLAVGLTLFSWGDMATGQTRARASRGELLGLAMLLGSVCCDAACPNLQERLLRRFRQPKVNVVLATNALSALITACMFANSRDAQAAFAYLLDNRLALRVLLCQSLAGYLGISAYLGCIRHAGSKATVLVTTARKMLTIALSYTVFTSSAFTPHHALGITLSVIGMTGSALREASANRAAPPAASAASPAGLTVGVVERLTAPARPAWPPAESAAPEPVLLSPVVASSSRRLRDLRSLIFRTNSGRMMPEAQRTSCDLSPAPDAAVLPGEADGEVLKAGASKVWRNGTGLSRTESVPMDMDSSKGTHTLVERRLSSTEKSTRSTSGGSAGPAAPGGPPSPAKPWGGGRGSCRDTERNASGRLLGGEWGRDDAC
jgi:drug/metabolite transporter (DMT)-like permease